MLNTCRPEGLVSAEFASISKFRINTGYKPLHFGVEGFIFGAKSRRRHEAPSFGGCLFRNQYKTRTMIRISPHWLTVTS